MMYQHLKIPLFLFLIACDEPPAIVDHSEAVLVQAIQVSDFQWETTFQVAEETLDFHICNDWPEPHSIALIERGDKTRIWAVQFGAGRQCIIPADGAFEDIRLVPDVDYIVSVITDADNVLVEFSLGYQGDPFHGEDARTGTGRDL